MATNRQGGGSGGAGGIEDVQGVIAGDDVKVLHEVALWCHGLSTHSRAARGEVFRLDFRDESLEGLAETFGAE